jgi:uncharacterized RDD family membrane protein YckC
MENAQVQPDENAPRDWESAGFWIRSGAYMIDGIVLAAAGLIFRFLPDGLSIVLRIVLGMAYFTCMPAACRGQTLGKMAAGVAIIRMDGTGIGYGRAFLRWLGTLASTAIAGIGFLMAAFTGKKRALHDYVAGTRVVRVEPIGAVRKAAVIATGVAIPLVFVLGIAAAISIPLLAKREIERRNHANLESLRSALSRYYRDNSGRYPEQLSALVPRYLQAIPVVKADRHTAFAEAEAYGSEACSGNAAALKDTAKWGYVSEPAAPCFGRVFIDCVHRDSKGKPWADY